MTIEIVSQKHIAEFSKVASLWLRYIQIQAAACSHHLAGVPAPGFECTLKENLCVQGDISSSSRQGDIPFAR